MVDVSKYRAEVIEKFIGLEMMINAIICQHYLGRLNKKFLLEVLYDEYFSFALKRRVLEKIVSIDKRVLDDLNRLNTIRNYFAHCNVEFIDSISNRSTAKVPDPRKTTEEIDFEKLYAEFISREKPVREYLTRVYKESGGALVRL